MKRIVKEWVFRRWYKFVSKTDKNADVIFMNFGYWYDDNQISLSEDNEKNRVSIQLYHKLVSFVDIAGLEICEIGCGRGGGLEYIHKTFAPLKTTGLDLNKQAIDFCEIFYKLEGMSFIQGDAQSLPFRDESFDVIINIESSHRYPAFDSFLKETYRSLKPGGHLLITDFRSSPQINDTKEEITIAGYKILHEEIITQNVIMALEADDKRRRHLVKSLVPILLQKAALNFAGVVGSNTYKNFVEDKYTYFLYVLKRD
jgi:ubiquinone/menaquinone biosynthesis C-methylase UbiE